VVVGIDFNAFENFQNYAPPKWSEGVGMSGHHVRQVEAERHRPFFPSQPEEHSESFPHIGEDVKGGGRGEFDAPSVPIQILDVIG
jgi:hypothetical protein